MPTTEPGGPRHGTQTAISGADTAAVRISRYSVPQASRRLGISERAVRKRIEVGSLLALREGRSWVVILEEPLSGPATEEPSEPAVYDAAPSELHAEPAAPNTASTPSVDLTPLVDLVDRLTQRNAQLTEAAAIWQVRAMQLEERLKQLTAGPIEQEPVEAGDGAPAPDQGQTANDECGINRKRPRLEPLPDSGEKETTGISSREPSVAEASRQTHQDDPGRTIEPSPGNESREAVAEPVKRGGWWSRLFVR